MADHRALQSLERMLRNILGEVTAVKQTVQAHDARFDDVMFQLKALKQSRDVTQLKTLPGCGRLLERPVALGAPAGERVQNEPKLWDHALI